jgi:hypothetical protein
MPGKAERYPRPGGVPARAISEIISAGERLGDSAPQASPAVRSLAGHIARQRQLYHERRSALTVAYDALRRTDGLTPSNDLLERCAGIERQSGRAP